MGSSFFALAIGVRAALVCALFFGALQLLVTRQYYATALIVGGLAVMVLADLARSVAKADRMLARFIDGLAAEELERPGRTFGGVDGFRRLTLALEHAVSALHAGRAERQLQIDYLQALVDNMPVASLVVGEDGAIEPANRVAHKLAGRPVHRLDEIAAIGAPAALRIQSLSPGERAVVRLANGHRVLASASSFSAAGARRRLISLHNIESELDAVELKAWQDLVRILAHEMMNSLTPISSLAESIRPLLSDLRAADATRAEIATADVATAIDAIARRSVGLMSFVERYRKVATLPRPTLQPVRPDELVRRIDQLLGPTLAGKRVAYASRVEAEMPAVMADRDLMEQALINLVHNAADAAAGLPDARVDIECRRRDRQWIEVAVADNGPGLDANVIDHIFIPFFTTKTGGSGIGLSLARQIALAHGGQVEVAPNQPRGAVFTLVIPVAREAADTQPSAGP